jgi:Concanavalin A-like lectin/glucanases superfamily
MANWTPPNLGSALLGWFDASDAATVTITGSGVSAWNNKGVSSFALSQGTDANRPTYASNTITFTNPQVLGTVNPLTAYDVLLVGKPTSNLADWRTALHSVDGHNTILLEQNTNNLGTYNAVAPYFRQAGTWVGGVSGLAYGQVSDAGPVTISRDGGSLVSTGCTQPTGDTAINFVGGYFGASGGSQGWGDIYELIFVPYNSSVDTRQKLEGYAAWKWGLQGLLPSNHPYKAAPPSDTDQNISATGIASTVVFGTAVIVRAVDVVLLCHLDNALIDASSYAHTLTPIGLAALSASNPKFGSGSLYYNVGNAASAVSTNNAADFHFGTAPFTIEAWCYATAAGSGDGYNPILAEWDAVLGNVSFFFNVYPYYMFFWSPDGTNYSNISASPSALPLNTWTHVAADRDSANVLRVYVNGVVVASGSCPASFYPSTDPCMIGNDASASRAFPGYLDEVRVVRGTAMYGGAFTPPTAPFLPPDPGANIAPAGIASTTAFGTASVTPGPANIAATGIASTNAFGTAALLSTAAIAATGIAKTNAFGTASLTPGPVNVTATGIASTNAFGTASLSRGAVNISATGIGSTTAFGTAGLLATASLSPTGIASITAFGTGTISSEVGASRSISATGIASTNVFGHSSIRAGTLAPRALISPHGNICCDPAYRPLRGPQNVCQVHFRPARPYPGYILGPGIGVSVPKAEPPRATVTVAAPAYRLRPIAGPSATGPWTYRDTQGSYPIFRSGAVGTGEQNQ